MPVDFPLAAYEAVHLKVAPHRAASEQIYNQFAGGWNAITYRYNAFAEYDDHFSESIGTYGAAPPAEERYRQERDLFGFFSSGFSTFEAFFYAAFAAGAFLQPGKFPIGRPEDQRNISAGTTLRAYRTAFPAAPLITALDATVQDPAYRELRDIRNVLSHRSAPGRTIHVALGGEPAPNQWKLDNINLDKNTTVTRRHRACSAFTDVMNAFRSFVDAQF